MNEMAYKAKYDELLRTYTSSTPKGKAFYEKAKDVLTGGETRSLAYFYPYPLVVEKAVGSGFYDLDGNHYLDFLNNYTSMLHGHAHPYIEEKIVAALKKGTNVTAVLPEQYELAAMLCGRIPGLETVRFCNCGTEATMFAVRAARIHTGKDKLIKMEGGYHGAYDLVEYNFGIKLAPGEQYSKKPVPVSKGIPDNAGKDLIIAPFNDLAVMEEILKANAKDVAAIMLEPVMGVAGFIKAEPGYLAGLRKLADQYGVLLIFDEVQSLRLSTGGAQKKYDVMPDLTAMGKIIGGGLPVGAFGGRLDIMSVYDSTKGKVSQSGTFSGNRPTMAGGLAAMELFDQAAVDKIDALAERLEAGILQAAQKAGVPASVCRDGSLMQMHFTEKKPHDYASTATPYAPLNPLFHLALLQKGIYIAPRGAWALSTVMNEAEIDKAIGAVEYALGQIKELF